MTFINPDVSALSIYNKGLAFEQLSGDEKLSYFHKVGNILKLKNSTLVSDNKDSFSESLYHDDFFVYFQTVIGNSSKEDRTRSILAIPRDIIKYAFYHKIGNSLHEELKKDLSERFYGNLNMKRSLAIVKIVCSATNISIPIYHYDLDGKFLFMPYFYRDNVVHSVHPKSRVNSSDSGNLELDWINISHNEDIKYDDIPNFFIQNEMNIGAFFKTMNVANDRRIMTVLERVLLKKNFVMDKNTVQDETIAQVLFSEIEYR